MQTLRLGSRGQDVRILQQALALHVDGIFGPVTEEAVKFFQTRKSLVADGIVGPNTWAVLDIGQSRRTISKIILHCTATPEGRDFSVEQVRQWHLARGFSDIGYHYLVGRDGTIYAGRPESVVGAHCTGQNTCSIGVSYVGGEEADGSHRPKDTRTHAQKKALRELVASLQKKYPGATVHCHNEFANKACPSFKLCDL
ncbi:N-acetylmuramoyl-L-alanine amidase [Duncaniella muris]|jgi:N-acetylmuramoyl-L-alanine amidase|uniref:peptidoglycan recognition protein family protein n=1 Tax=Duncaniella muris TaxID=2094150 RepID=UPI002676C66F|nr:N-acetylmuramoyl-L-alanine amidase [Duncaniella muris]